MKKYAIVREATVCVHRPYRWLAYEYSLFFRLAGVEWCASISDSYSSESAEHCERLLRKHIAMNGNRYEIVRIVEV